MTTNIREHLHQQIDHLPDEIVQRLADLVALMVAQAGNESLYADWDDETWQEFALSQFFREEDEVEYTLADVE